MGELQNSLQSDDVRALVHNNVLSKSHYTRAQAFFRNNTAWHAWALRALLAFGAGHVLAGIIFFFAFNWNDLSEFTKFGLVQGGMIISAIMWMILKLDTPIAQAFGIALTVMIGVFLAVFGQIYQTPVAIYTPFIVWGILAFPLAFVSRSVAHWALWLIIVCIALCSFITFNLAPRHGEVAVIGALMCMSFCMFICLCIYDYVQGKWQDWSRAAWFRVFLVTLMYGFCVAALLIAIGKNSEYLAILVVLLGGGLLSYLYWQARVKTTKPPLARIACLVVGACGFATIVAILGFRIILEISDFLGVFLLGFLLMAGLTYCLARSFKYFIHKFKVAPEKNVEPEQQTSALETNTHKTITEFAAKFALSESEVTHVIDNHAEEHNPWYMELFLGIAGMITSILAMGFMAALLFQVSNLENEYTMIAMGIIVFGVAVLLRAKNDGLFSRHFFSTIILGGGALATFGVGLVSRGKIAFILFAVMMSFIAMVVIKDRILEFVMASGIAAICVYAAFHYNLPYPFTSFFILCSVLGLFCITYPVKTALWQTQKSRVFDAAGTAFLLAPCLTAFVFYIPKLPLIPGNPSTIAWVEGGISICVTAIAILYLNKICLHTARMNPPLNICILLLIIAGFMPLGGAAALLVLLTGYILGKRSLAVIGALLQIIFIVLYYYDLSMTLIYKSYLLMGVGVLLLLAYGFAHKKGKNHA
ncbi:MAG: hypothetical protein COA43_10695 [Robiginitomaculum sp.]|nr:MAG: hypothetical protein COA43_10695 [Robiginitomaculum sp.]